MLRDRAPPAPHLPHQRYTATQQSINLRHVSEAILSSMNHSFLPSCRASYFLISHAGCMRSSLARHERKRYNSYIRALTQNCATDVKTPQAH
jgi:hypothetical protein